MDQIIQKQITLFEDENFKKDKRGIYCDEATGKPHPLLSGLTNKMQKRKSKFEPNDFEEQYKHAMGLDDSSSRLKSVVSRDSMRNAIVRSHQKINRVSQSAPRDAVDEKIKTIFGQFTAN